MLGGLGRTADRLMLIGDPQGPEARILQAGRGTSAWIGEDVGGRMLNTLPPDCLLPALQAIGEAMQSATPIRTAAYRVRNGVVEKYDLLALPMACRWGPPMAAIYVHECGSRYDLIDGIFKVTGDGILALAAIRDGAGNTRDLQIVAFNDAAARLLQIGREELLWRKLSDLGAETGHAEAFARMMAAAQSGGSDVFELSLSGSGDATHLKVGISTVNDLLSVTLTDVSELKRREASVQLLFDSNPMPMWLYDPATLKILAVNGAAVANYGYSREEFEAKSLYEIWPRDEWNSMASGAQRSGILRVGTQLAAHQERRHRVGGFDLRAAADVQRQSRRCWLPLSTSPSVARPKPALPIWRITMR